MSASQPPNPLNVQMNISTSSSPLRPPIARRQRRQLLSFALLLHCLLPSHLPRRCWLQRHLPPRQRHLLVSARRRWEDCSASEKCCSAAVLACCSSYQMVVVVGMSICKKEHCCYLELTWLEMQLLAAFSLPPPPPLSPDQCHQSYTIWQLISM